MDDVIGKLLEENNMPDTPTARAIYRKMLEHHAEDDDIQDYKKPWVGLTDAEIKKICDCTHGYDADERIARAIEKLLKDKNS